MNFIVNKEKALKSWRLRLPVENQISDEYKLRWMKEYAELHSKILVSDANAWQKINKKEIKRVYSDIDPFGEENWEE